MTPVRQSDRAFGFMFATLFAVIFGVAGIIWDLWLIWCAVAAAVFLILAVAAPWVLLPFNRLWAAFAVRLSVVSNHLLLGLFFFFVVTPVGLVARLFGWDPMGRRGSGRQSYWTAVGRQTDRETLRDMF